jgi:glutathione S-transferase
MTLTLHEHPFAAYCWKVRIALYERDLPFEPNLIGDATDRARLAELWPRATIPVLVDDAAGITLPESTIVIEYLDGLGDAPRLIPADRGAALRARLWDRVIDGHVMTPTQKIVLDSLRPAGRADPEGVADAHTQLARAYDLLDAHWPAGPGSPGRRSPWPTAPRRRRSSTLASCTAGTRKASRTSPPTSPG